MPRSKSSISKASSYRGIAEFWDSNDLSDYWDQTTEVAFEVDIQSEATYYPVEAALSNRISRLAKKRGVSPETLLNLWLQERLSKEAPAK